MDVKYTQCDICKNKAERPYKFIIEPRIEDCNYVANKIDICEDCLNLIYNLSTPKNHGGISVLSGFLKYDKRL